MDKKYRVIVAHPGKQHSFQLATALKQNGLLYKYITTVYDRPGSLTALAKKILKGNLRKKAETRKTDSLTNEDIIQFNEFRALLLLLISKIPKSDKIWKKACSMLADSFGRKVARYAIKEQVDAVICFDSNCTVLFEILKKEAPNIKRIMDVSIANRIFMKENYIEDMKKTGDEGIKKEQIHLWDKNNIRRLKQEIEDSQYFIVASEIVKKSLLFSGVMPEQIGIVPYGVDSTKFSFIEKNILQKPLKLIYVGQITYRKGIHHLLKVISEFPESEVRLTLAGGYSETSALYKNYRNYSNIEFLGFVTRDALAQAYQAADVFVFPTLGEGYGLVVLEAMSCGLPVIVSDCAGGNDAITQYEDGIVFKAGDDDELKDSIQWFIDHPDRLPEFSRKAHEKSILFSWDIYYESVARLIVGWLKK